MTTLPILYSFRRCPYAMRARLALLNSGIACELREVRLSAKPAELIAASPKATVPVLILPDQTVIDESIDIMRWALELRDKNGWLQGDSAETDRLIAQNDGVFKHHLDRYKYPEKFGSDAIEYRDAGTAILREYDAILSHQTYLSGQSPGLADYALLPFIRQFAHIDRDYFYALPLPHLIAWLTARLGEPLFANVMRHFPVWRIEPESQFLIES